MVLNGFNEENHQEPMKSLDFQQKTPIFWSWGLQLPTLFFLKMWLLAQDFHFPLSFALQNGYNERNSPLPQFLMGTTLLVGVGKVSDKSTIQKPNVSTAYIYFSKKIVFFSKKYTHLFSKELPDFYCKLIFMVWTQI